ncbi:inositol hexakisphosphate and diphosphoinositol-pentakisphosphate kinase isoform X9 [Vespa crabro]|uniref:inositol hexakisphosphate and diphosphoinositol-pentakisphosphate kinase isoform X9 n=1 Tax=Vespa crabro TaxID=7445 RepID=UPI001EFFE0AF|nr:inositol hexakisphosphate and diphosphoinositol-pentakisphosphate kinase isoform X9 [Vespa crabro]
MSYTELEHGYQGLRSASRPIFYVGDINSVQSNLIGPVASSIYRSSKRAELSEGCGNDDACMGGTDLEGEGKQVLVGICAMAKKSQSKPMKEILTRLEEFEYIKIVVFPEEVILKESVEDWPIVDCLISFHSKGFPLDKAINYADLRNPFIINNLPMQYDIQDRRRVYAILESEGIEIPRYAVLDRDSADPKQPFPDHELVESEDHVEVNGVIFNKPFVEKPVSAEDHNIYIYYPTSAGGGSQRLFRKIGSRSSVYSPESRVRKTGSYIYEDFMPTDGTDVKVYTVGPDYAHAEARKSPALDGKVERDSEGKEIRYPVILSNAEKLISRKVCLAFKQTVCGFDLLRANGQSFVCDVNGFSFVKNSNKYYDDCAKILGNMILRELAPTLHIPWSVPFQLDDPPIVPTTFGKMMELRCVVAVIRHGDRTPKQKMKVEVRHPKFFEIFAKYDGYKHGHVKLKRPKQLQEILDTARSLLAEIQHRAAGPELEEKQGKLEQLKSVLEMYGHFSGINRKVQMKYQPRGRPRGSSSDDDRLGEPSLVLILKWGGELTPAGRIQAEELGRIFRCMYPGGQEEDTEMLPNHGEYAGAQGLGLLRLHSTFRHDLKIYASDEGRVQMTAAAFAKGLLALEGELTPILVQMVKSANTNGLLDNDCDSSKYQNMVKTRLHELLQQDREFTREDREQINPGNALSINAAMDFVKNPVKCCQHVHALIQKLMDIVRIKKDDPKTKDAILYHGETWELMGRRWGKIEKDFCTKNKRFDISKIPDIYDCIKYDLQHNNHTLQFDHAEELYIYAKYLADIVIPQEYGLTVQEKLTIGQGICTPLLKKIRADLQRNIEESGEETVNRLNPRYSHGVSSPGRHVRTRLYFTSESHVHSLLTVLRYGGLLDVVKDEQWRRAMEYVSMVSELNYMSQIVVMLYEDPTKDPSSEERFHVELHFSPGVNCCVQKNLPPGPGFRPHSRNESSHNMGESGGSGQDSVSQCSTRIEEEDTELSILEDEIINPQIQTETSPTVGNDVVDSTLDSPTTSRGIDMMDLDPNMMDEPYDSGFLQSSAPIPIRHVMRIINSRTVAGHEAARLGSQLAASQRQRREREASVMVEPRARSYDHQHQEKAEKAADKLQYQSLDAVNKEEKTEHSNYYKNTLNVPVYLGQPIALPHSVSSPELPIPCVQTSIPISPPLITVHDIPLASPINYNYKKNTSAPSPPKDLLMSDLDSYHLSSVNQEQLKNKKTHGGFHTEIILPNIKVDGESNDFDPMSESPSMVNSSSLSLSSHNNLCPIGTTISTVNVANPVENTNDFKRSRSLSPCPTRCLCYNCNVSELILQSRDLPPLERSNFRTYFVRSLSHKFFNCSCYTLANIWQNLSPNLSQCSSCCDIISSTDSLAQNRGQFLNPSCSLVHLASHSNQKIYKKHYLIPISPDKQTSNSQSPTGSPSKCNCIFSQRHYLRRDSHGTDLSMLNEMKRTPTEESISYVLRRSNSCPNIITRFNLEVLVSHSDPHNYLGNNSSSISHCPQNRRRYSCSDTKKQNVSQHLIDNGILHGHVHSNNSHYHESSHCKSNNHEPKCPRAPFSQLQPQRSFSSPDTRPSIIQPDPTCTARRHRHSISGQMSYFKLLGYNVSKKLTGSANSLFSTAVISGSSSAPNLKDMIPSHAMIPQHVAAIEGFGGVPPIRPLETLHNALSLRQLDSFLEMMTSAPLFRTPASSPPKYPSPGGSVNPNLNVGGISREYQSSDLEAVRYCKKLNNVPLYITPTPIQYKSCGDGDTCDIRNQPSPTSPNSTGWSSEPQSFLSSEPSSPAPTSTGECSMSISLISNDGAPSYSGAPKFPTTPGLDLDFNDFCMNIDQENHEGRGSVSYTDYYSNEDGQIRKGPSYTSTTQKTVVSSDDLPVDTVDDDEEHTLTLRQTEAQKKQDVKLLFEQVENPNATKSTVGYKKIGRFRVESMEISDDDVRIKEPSSACSSTDKNKLLTLQKMEITNTERGPTHRNKETRHKRKNFSRSQSVSTPKTFVAKSDTNFSFKSVKSKESSFSAMTDKDLEKWKLSSTKSDPSTSCTETQKEPILTMASSLTDSPSVTIGFDIQDKKNE